MSNDPRRNINNLLFRPNNSIDDGQPAFYFYNQSAPPPLSNKTSTTTVSFPPNTTGLNNNPNQFPDVNQANLFDAALYGDYRQQNIIQSQQFPTEPPLQSAQLFPTEKQQIKLQAPDKGLFLNTNALAKTTTTEQAYTVSAYSTIAVPAKPAVGESVPSIPLISAYQADFTSHHTAPGTIVSDPVQQVPIFNAALPSTRLINSGPLIDFFDSVATSNIAKEIESPASLNLASVVAAEQPLFRSNSELPEAKAIETLPAVPLFSPRDLPVKSTSSAPSSAGPTNSYRRTGSKRPVYAPIPGLQNQYPAITQKLESQHLSREYLSTPLLTAQLSAHKITTAQSPFSEPIDSSQENSPFLCPVSVPPVLGDDFIRNPIQSSTTPNTGDSQIPMASTVMYQNNERLSPVVGSISTVYKPPNYHWFYKKEIGGKNKWEPFSINDSRNLEDNFTSHDLIPEKNIPTDGGRCDVNILRRQRTSVYWDSKPSEVRRCSWFHKSHSDSKRVPFEENVATKLEEEYKSAIESNQWPKRVDLPSGETVMFHTHDTLMLFSNSPPANIMDNNQQDCQERPRIVKRGIDRYSIDEGESEKIDHLLFMVHGIGAGCDLKFRPVEEVVDDFRNIALQLVRTHYRSSCDKKLVNRVEILPIGWHSKLHSEDTGIDNKLKSITLESIPKLREFTNDALLDILFYTSPFYGQTIISTVGTELNRIYDLFRQRNPNFTGGISLAGHSLGSLILFDMLCNQVPVLPDIEQDSDDEDNNIVKESKPRPLSRKMSRRISYVVGSRGTGQAQVNYPILNFQPATFFALGSPIGMFVTIRGLDNLGENFALPTCPGFFNIFHPYDPVAYRIESLINPQLANVKPVLIPHHKGRKRMHLELKETMAKVGSDLKQKLVDSMKNTWNSLLGWSNTKPALAEEVDKVLEQFASKHSTQKENDEPSISEAVGMNLGMLNKGRRIDYVLQEAPVEFFNEYLFVLSSHVCYWDSEDTVLLIIKEIYNILNVSPDSQIPQQTMTIERPPSQSRTPDQLANPPAHMGVDPTVPMKKDGSVGPPPLSGFVKHQ